MVGPMTATLPSLRAAASRSFHLASPAPNGDVAGAAEPPAEAWALGFGAVDPAAEAEKSLRRLAVDQVDLYIVHWPQKGPTWAWPGMEEARRRGYARSIGVSNFSARELEQVTAPARTVEYAQAGGEEEATIEQLTARRLRAAE